MLRLTCFLQRVHHRCGLQLGRISGDDLQDVQEAAGCAVPVDKLCAHGLAQPQEAVEFAFLAMAPLHNTVAGSCALAGYVEVCADAGPVLPVACLCPAVEEGVC